MLNQDYQQPYFSNYQQGQSSQIIQQTRRTSFDRLLQKSHLFNDKAWVYDMYFSLDMQDSFLNAVGVAYFQHLIRPSTPLSECQRFLSLVENQQCGFNMMMQSAPQTYQSFLQDVRNLLQLRNQLLQSEIVIGRMLNSNIISLALKFLVAYYLETNEKQSFLEIIETLQLNQIDKSKLPYIIKAMAYCLQIQIVIESEATSEVSIYEYQESQSAIPLISLLDLQSQNHYCILYTKEQTSLDGLNSQGQIIQNPQYPPQIKNALRKPQDQWPKFVGFPIYSKKQEKFPELIRNQNYLIELLAQRINQLYDSMNVFAAKLSQYQNKRINIQIISSNQSQQFTNSEQTFTQQLIKLINENQVLIKDIHMSQSQKLLQDQSKLFNLGSQQQNSNSYNTSFYYEITNIIGEGTQYDAQNCLAFNKKSTSKKQLECKHMFHKPCLTQSIMLQTYNQIIGQPVFCPKCMESKQLQQLSEEIILNTVDKQKFSCPVCGQELDIEKNCCTLNCLHQVCHQCLTQ